MVLHILLKSDLCKEKVMEILNVLLEYMKFEDRNINELIELSSLIDGEKNTNGILVERDDDIAVIASVIVALINEKSTMKMGEKILNDLNAVIVKKNLDIVEINNGKELYEQLQEKELPGTFKIKTTPTGYKFEFVAADGEVLAVSELYSKLEPCLNGIMSVQKNSTGEIENQTEEIINTKKNPKYEIYIDKTGEYRFRLKARNGEIIAVSLGFKEVSKCVNTIRKMKVAIVSSDTIKE